MAPNPISFSEIDAYCRLQKLVMAGWEVDLLRRVDVIALHKPKEGSPRPKEGAAVQSLEPSPASAAEAKHRLRAGFKDRRVVKRAPKPSTQE